MGERRLRVLVVEDEAFIALDTTELLEQAGHEVCGTAADREEALRLAGRDRPDVALVDLRLADGPTGLEVSRELRERHGTVCILTTAYPRELWPGGPHGALGRLGKPYVPEALGGAIEYCLGLAEGRLPSGDPPRGLEVLA